MLFNCCSNTLRRVSVLAIIALVFLVGSKLYLTARSNALLNQSSVVWSEYQSTAVERQKLLRDLEVSLGYGGFIHNFKNYLLRHDLRYKKAFEDNVLHIRKSVDAYLSNPQSAKIISDEERWQFEIILNTVNRYADNIALVTQGYEKNLAILEIDDLVRVDDTAAIQAMNVLNALAEREQRNMFKSLEELNQQNLDIQKLRLFFLPVFVLFGILLVFLIFRLTHEISSRETVEQEIRLYKRRLLSTLEHMRDAFIMADTRGFIEDINLAGLEMFGYTKDDILGQNVKILMPKVFRDEHDGYMDQYQKTGKKGLLLAPRELEGQRKDGSVFPLEISLSQIDLDDKTFFAALIRDITDRKKTEDSLREKEKMESLAAMAGGLAHEINNALQPILGLSEAMVDRIGKEDEKGAAYMGTIRDNAFHVRNIVKSVLVFSHKGQREVETHALHGFLNDVIEFADEFVPSGVEIDISNVAQNLEDYDIEANTTSMVQVFTNLFTNASHAMEQSGVIRIVTDIQYFDLIQSGARDVAEGPYAVVTVADTGCGIDEQTCEHIFEPFFTTKPTGVGTGLGLAAVYGIIRNMKGNIEVSSTPGEGTIFTLYLPVHKSNRIIVEEGQDG